jgi:alpha-beta hydrolase superfamily lysophospholipase
MASPFDDPIFNERLFFPRSDAKPCPSGATDLMLTVAPGVALHARWYPASGSRATVVVFHGNGEIVADYDDFAARYHGEVGADLVAVDFRGYGRSEGVPNYRACIEDSRAVVAELRRALGERLRAPLIVLGRSLGGACAAELAGQVPPVVDGIVMESAAADPRGVMARRGLSLDAALTAEETKVFDPRPKLARCPLPVLVLHAASDRTISASEARENFRKLGHPASRLVLIPRRDHHDVILDDAYFVALRDFVSSVERASHGPSANEREPDATRSLRSPGFPTSFRALVQRGAGLKDRVNARVRDLTFSARTDRRLRRLRSWLRRGQR